MDILKLIKNRKSIRRYKDKPIPKRVIDKIIEAGIWGPSIHGYQAWNFIIIMNKDTIKKISDLIMKKSSVSSAGVNIMLHSAADIVNNSQAIIAIYISKDLEKIRYKFKEVYSRFARIIKISQFSAISAAIQNMILTAQDLGIGSCWLNVPLFCKKEISEILDTKDELMTILTLGYPAEKGRRSPRKPLSETITYIR